MKTVPVTFEALDALTDVDALCLLLTEDERPLQGAAGLVDWRLCGELSRALKSGFFAGAVSERLLVPVQGRLAAERLFAMGLGHSTSVSLLGFEHAVRVAREVLVKAGVTSVAFTIPRVKPDAAELLAVIQRVFEGEPIRWRAFASTTGRVV